MSVSKAEKTNQNQLDLFYVIAQTKLQKTNITKEEINDHKNQLR